VCTRTEPPYSPCEAVAGGGGYWSRGRHTGKLGELIEAYARAREAHPELEFAEVAQRFQQGEDVIGSASQGSLMPLSLTSGWQIRVEYGSLNAEALDEVLSRVITEARVSVMRPGSDVWEPASRVRESIKR
jgi:hypothetical protein